MTIALLHAPTNGNIAGVRCTPTDAVYLAGNGPLKARGDTVIAAHTGEDWADICNALTSYPYPPEDSWATVDFSPDTFTAAEVMEMLYPGEPLLEDEEPPAPEGEDPPAEGEDPPAEQPGDTQP